MLESAIMVTGAFFAWQLFDFPTNWAILTLTLGLLWFWGAGSNAGTLLSIYYFLDL